MIFLPNAGGLVTPSYYPSSVQSYASPNAANHGSEGDFNSPPDGLVAAILASEWTINCNISSNANGLTLTETYAVIKTTLAGQVPITGLSDLYSGSGLSSGWTIGAIESSDEPPEKRIGFFLNVWNWRNVQWGNLDGKWRWPFTMTVSDSTPEEDPPDPEFPTMINSTLFSTGTNPSLIESGLAVTFFGESIPMYATGSGDALGVIGGAITITPSKTVSFDL